MNHDPYLPRGVAAVNSDSTAAASSGSRRDCLEDWLVKGKQLTFSHAPLNGHLAPTVLIPNFAELLKLSETDQLQFIHDVLRALHSDVKAGGWEVQPGEFFVKGTNSTRSNVACKCKNEKEMLAFMKQAHTQGAKLVRKTALLNTTSQPTSSYAVTHCLLSCCCNILF